jgi:hypothetical protein
MLPGDPGDFFPRFQPDRLSLLVGDDLPPGRAQSDFAGADGFQRSFDERGRRKFDLLRESNPPSPPTIPNEVNRIALVVV